MSELEVTHDARAATALRESLSAGGVRLGMGTAPIGNLYNEVGADHALRALQAAYARGIRHFDTAPYYGHGLAEQRLGQYLAQTRHEDVVISTKVGRRIEADERGCALTRDGFAVRGTRAVFDYSTDGIERSFDASLQRLGVDHIHGLFLHDIGRQTHGERHPDVLRMALEQALPAMARLREQGVVDWIGVGVNEVEVCQELIPQFDLDCIMLAGRYTLFEQRDALALLQLAHDRDVRIMAAGPYNSGLLADSSKPGSMYNYQPADPAVRDRADVIYDICRGLDVDVGAAALQFPLAHPAVCHVVAGMRSDTEAQSAIERSLQHLPNELWTELKAAGIVDPSAPVPNGEKTP